MKNNFAVQADVDFPGNFQQDNFASRRTTGHNMFDPDALITGDELAQGLTFTNSRRMWKSEDDYQFASRGYWSVASIVAFAPRVRVPEVL